MLKTIPIEQFGKRDFDGLCAFLEACREEARRDGHGKIASISLAVGHIDPLAVLESIYEESQLHFYWENPARGIAVAGAEAVEVCTSSGPDRFRDIRVFSDAVLEHCIAVGEIGEPFSGPHFFSAFTFAEGEDEDGSGHFPPARVFLPRWQVSRCLGRYTAVANVPVSPDADIVPLAERVWAAHGKFQRFDYPQAALPVASGSDPAGRLRRTEVGGPDRFEQSVEDALSRIRAGRYDKIVLSRAIDVLSELPLNPLDSLNRLRNEYASCYAFSVSSGDGQSFIGATPERLIGVEEGALHTEALAGSAPRGRNAREDAAFARALLESGKNAHEHQVVVDSIVRRLEAVGAQPEVAHRRELLQLSNVQHLRSPISARVPKGVHLLDILASLHPTPAVGGTPREAAIADIRGFEPFARGLFTGAIGWFNAQGWGEFVVAIRSALIDGKSARVFAGSGIVEGSDPQREKQETDLKLAAVLDRLA
jgi:menaquinone-specific isochorismate synthase